MTRRRAEALASAAAGYTATHGHPLDHPRDNGDDRPAAARWHLTRHQALVAGAAVLLLAAGVVVRAVSGMPAAPEALGAAVPGTSTTTTSATTSHGLAASPTTAEAPSAAAAEPSGTAAAGVAVAGADAAGLSGARPPAEGGPVAGAPVVVVHVVGRVTTPGVLTLPAGSRVADAVAAAGGAAPEADLTAVNLARPLVDGEQVRVPAPGDPVGPAPAPAPAGSAGGPDAAAGRTAASPVALNTADTADLDALPGIGPVLAGRIVDWRTQNGPFRSVDELGEVAGIGEALLLRLRPLVRV